jgi:hypothetical protein
MGAWTCGRGWQDRWLHDFFTGDCIFVSGEGFSSLGIEA